jgi:hypothetical protein
MADKLTFTTTVSASINPVAVFTPVNHAFQLASAAATGVADRSDVHQVTVALAVAKGALADLGSLRSYLLSSERSGTGGRPGVTGRTSTIGRVFIGTSVTGNSTSVSELLALRAIDQLKSRKVQLIPPP